MKASASALLACPCGQRSGRGLATLAACCGPRLSGEQPAPDAEALMRSRYTAYVLGHADYVLATWHERTRPATLELDPAAKWLGLEVKQRLQTGDNQAEVSFVARFRLAGRAVRLTEHSRFVRENGLWYYVDGDVS